MHSFGIDIFLNCKFAGDGLSTLIYQTLIYQDYAYSAETGSLPRTQRSRVPYPAVRTGANPGVSEEFG